MKKISKRLLKGLGANAFGQVASIIIQLVSVPIFLQTWGVEIYGEWLILSTIPSYFTMSDIGFANVAANEMTMAVAKGNKKQALEVFQSTWIFISVICLALFSILALTSWLMPIERWLNLSHQTHSETFFIVLVLTLHVLLKLQGGMLSAGFRCDGNYAFGVIVANSIRLTESLAVAIVAWMGGSLLNAAIALLIFQGLGLLYMKSSVHKLSPWISYGFTYVKLSTIRHLSRPAVAFMGFPLGNALNNQGIVTVVAIILGPKFVVIFSTIRTISRLAFQAMGMINNAVWPEISAAYGSGNIDLARKLHHHACQVSIWLSGIVAICLLLFGESLLQIWTRGKVEMDQNVFYIFLIVIIVSSFWLTSSVVPCAINQHQRIALYYISGTGASVLIASLLTPHLGLAGAAISVLITDLIMSIHVLRTSLKILQDDFPSFIKIVVTPPIFKVFVNA